MRIIGEPSIDSVLSITSPKGKNLFHARPVAGGNLFFEAALGLVREGNVPLDRALALASAVLLLKPHVTISGPLVHVLGDYHRQMIKVADTDRVHDAAHEELDRIVARARGFIPTPAKKIDIRDLGRFIAYEISPVVFWLGNDESEQVESFVSVEDAEFARDQKLDEDEDSDAKVMWSLYGRLPTAEAVHIADYELENEALDTLFQITGISAIGHGISSFFMLSDYVALDDSGTLYLKDKDAEAPGTPAVAPTPSPAPALAVLQRALTALNTSRSFKVPSLGVDSYHIAAEIEAVLRDSK